MTTETSPASRRRFFKITAVGLAAAPFANALLSGVAQAVDMVKETDPTAAALGYVMDAAKSTKRTDKAAMCGNCSLFSGKPGAPRWPLHDLPGQSGQCQGLVHCLGQEGLNKPAGGERRAARAAGRFLCLAMAPIAYVYRGWSLRRCSRARCNALRAPARLQTRPSREEALALTQRRDKSIA